ncbi:MAG: universal stress protein [Solirubrobacteraceae bacterium]
MRALIWIVEDTWEATVAAALAVVGGRDDLEVTLLHVAPGDVEHVAEGARRGLLGRRPPPAPPHEVRDISDEAAAALLEEAARRLGRPAATVARRGRVEREVVAAAEGFDLLVLARDGDRRRLGPKSFGPPTRFVVDHAPCAVLVVWPDEAPGVGTIPPPPH